MRTPRTMRTSIVKAEDFIINPKEHQRECLHLHFYEFMGKL